MNPSYILDALKAHIDSHVLDIQNQLGKDMELMRIQHRGEIQSLQS